MPSVLLASRDLRSLRPRGALRASSFTGHPVASASSSTLASGICRADRVLDLRMAAAPSTAKGRNHPEP